MFVDFWALPPEANSFRLSSGAGPAAHAPEIAAYQTAAITHAEQAVQQTVTTAATVPSWQGPGGAAMATSSAGLSGYNGEVAGFAEKAVATITGLTTAYTAAVAATVHYSIAIANRFRQAGLIASNIIGQNTIAIAEGEAEYQGFWGENAMASTGYAAAATPLLGALEIPLTASPMGANPAGVGAGMAAVGAQAAGTVAHALGTGLSQGLGAAAQAMSTGTSMATGAASTVGSQAAASTSPGSGQGSSAGAGQGSGTGTSPGQGKTGAEDFMSQAQTMAGPAMQGPQAAGQALSGVAGQGSQLFSGAGQAGQLASSMGPGMASPGGLGAGPGVSALSAGPGNVGGLSAGNGGFAGGGSGVTAALTKPTAGGAMPGSVGLPGNWWSGAADDKVPVAGARGEGAGARGAGAAGAPGMYGMGQGGAGKGRNDSREASEADKQVLLDGFGGGMPVFTDSGGVVYASGQGV